MYSHKFVGGQDSASTFETIDGIGYAVRFKPNTDYIPLEEPWRDNFYRAV